MNFIDEKNDGRVGHGLFGDTFQTLLKLTPMLGTCHHGTERKLQNFLILESVRNLALIDATSQSKGHRRFTHSRLTDENRVGLGFSSQDLHNPANFVVSAHNGLNLALPHQSHDVP